MGKIKDGLGSLIGNAGEYYVMAELLKRGIISALAPRNAPGFDILATNPEKTVRIRVKTKSEQFDVWQYMAKKDGEIFRFLQEKEDFTILVHLADNVIEMRYFVVPTKVINAWLIEDFEEWLRTPGRGGRMHSKENKKRNLPYHLHEKELISYENGWDSLWK